MVGLAYTSSVIGCFRQKRRLPLIPFSLVLLGLGIFTFIQVIPIPETWLAVLSPKAHELKRFATSELHQAAISYEPGITAREAAKLFIYALVTIVAYERIKTRRSNYYFIITVLVAVLATIIVGGAHRIAHVEKMLGLVSSAIPAHRLMTTFVNPNHAAGFTAWGAVIALGLAIEEPRKHLRIGFGALGVLCASVCILCASRGGFAVLAMNLTGLALLALLKKDQIKSRISLSWIAGTGLVAVLVGFMTKERILREFAGTPDSPLGLAGKLSAIQGSENIISDHLWLGIGRGSYVSLFSHYKTTPYQFIYTHPENIFIQLICDWGVVIGLGAFFGLVYLIAKSTRKTTSYGEIGLMLGLCGLFVQNLFDFSFELPGVAIPAVLALCVLAIRRDKKPRKLNVSSPARLMLTLLLPLGLLAAANYFAFERGVLEADLESLKKAPNVVLAERHPANAYAATQMAFHAENANPPQLRSALRWANLALYLAPSYAEAHLVAGRLLLKAGHRRQGFEQIRSAWKRTNQSTPTEYFKQISYFAKSADDYSEAVPRRNVVEDRPDEIALAKLIRWLVSQKKLSIASELVDRFANIEEIEDPKRLSAMALGYFYTKKYEDCLNSIRRLRTKTKDDSRQTNLELKALIAKGDLERALQVLEKLLQSKEANRISLLKQACNLALRINDFSGAKAYVQQLENTMAPTDRSFLELSRLKIRIAHKLKEDGKVLRLLDQALTRVPSAVNLRLQRAGIHSAAGRVSTALLDINFVLRIEPKNAKAKKMKALLTTSLH